MAGHKTITWNCYPLAVGRVGSKATMYNTGQAMRILTESGMLNKLWHDGINPNEAWEEAYTSWRAKYDKPFSMPKPTSKTVCIGVVYNEL